MVRFAWFLPLLSLLSVLGGTGCARVTTTDVARRELGTVTLASGPRVAVFAAHRRSHRRAGLDEQGRWFGYVSALDTEHIEIVLETQLPGKEPERRTLSSAECPTASDCQGRLAAATATVCDSSGNAIVIVPGKTAERRLAITPYRGALYEDKVHGEATRCEDTARLLPPLTERVADAAYEGACRALFDAKDAVAANMRCMLRWGSTTSFAAPSLAERITAAVGGAPEEDTVVLWVAAIGQGKRHPLDLEAAFYEAVLAPQERASTAITQLALAYAPSRTRRVRYLEQAIGKCKDGSLDEFGKTVAAQAAGLLADTKLTKQLQKVCGVEPQAPHVWHPSHLVAD